MNRRALLIEPCEKFFLHTLRVSSFVQWFLENCADLDSVHLLHQEEDTYLLDFLKLNPKLDVSSVLQYAVHEKLGRLVTCLQHNVTIDSLAYESALCYALEHFQDDVDFLFLLLEFHHLKRRAALNIAITSGHEMVTKWLVPTVECDAKTVHMWLESAIKEGHNGIILHLYEHFRPSISRFYFVTAMEHGRTETLKLLFAIWEGEIDDTILCYCATTMERMESPAHEEILRYFLTTHGHLINPNVALRYACLRGQREIAYLLMEIGHATFHPSWENIDEALRNDCLNFSPLVKGIK